jgi:hypothetical protein
VSVEVDPDEKDLLKEEDLFQNPERMLWKVVKYAYDADEKINGHRLSKGDVVKIGRVRFKVREIASPAYGAMDRRQKSSAKSFQQQFKKEIQSMLQE